MLRVYTVVLVTNLMFVLQYEHVVVNQRSKVQALSLTPSILYELNDLGDDFVIVMVILVHLT